MDATDASSLFHLHHCGLGWKMGRTGKKGSFVGCCTFRCFGCGDRRLEDNQKDVVLFICVLGALKNGKNLGRLSLMDCSLVV